MTPPASAIGPSAIPFALGTPTAGYVGHSGVGMEDWALGSSDRSGAILGPLGESRAGTTVDRGRVVSDACRGVEPPTV
jgi:hypothetical protein